MARGISCPSCGGLDSKVLATRPRLRSKRRERRCLACGCYFLTLELTLVEFSARCSAGHLLPQPAPQSCEHDKQAAANGESH